MEGQVAVCPKNRQGRMGGLPNGRVADDEATSHPKTGWLLCPSHLAGDGENAGAQKWHLQHLFEKLSDAHLAAEGWTDLVSDG